MAKRIDITLRQVKCIRCDGTGRVPMPGHLAVVYELMRRVGGLFSPPSLAKRFRVSPNAMNNRLEDLRAYGYVKREGRRNRWNYSVVALLMLMALFLSPLACGASERETEVVAAILVCEAGGEPLGGMNGVYEVISNRARARGLSNYAVVTQRKQFSCLNGVPEADLIATAKAHPKWSKAMELASKPVETHIVGNATHYHATSVHPYWAKDQFFVTQVGHHKFYKL